MLLVAVWYAVLLFLGDVVRTLRRGRILQFESGKEYVCKYSSIFRVNSLLHGLILTVLRRMLKLSSLFFSWKMIFFCFHQTGITIS